MNFHHYFIFAIIVVMTVAVYRVAKPRKPADSFRDVYAIADLGAIVILAAAFLIATDPAVRITASAATTFYMGALMVRYMHSGDLLVDEVDNLRKALKAAERQIPRGPQVHTFADLAHVGAEFIKDLRDGDTVITLDNMRTYIKRGDELVTVMETSTGPILNHPKITTTEFNPTPQKAHYRFSSMDAVDQSLVEFMGEGSLVFIDRDKTTWEKNSEGSLTLTDKEWNPPSPLSVATPRPPAVHMFGSEKAHAENGHTVPVNDLFIIDPIGDGGTRHRFGYMSGAGPVFLSDDEFTAILKASDVQT